METVGGHLGLSLILQNSHSIIHLAMSEKLEGSPCTGSKKDGSKHGQEGPLLLRFRAQGI